MSRIELDQCRLLVQQAAHLLDTVGNKTARKQISMIKVAVANSYQNIADRAIQLFGARGVTNDTPASRAFAKARAFRIYDGPDGAPANHRRGWKRLNRISLPLRTICQAFSYT